MKQTIASHVNSIVILILLVLLSGCCQDALGQSTNYYMGQLANADVSTTTTIGQSFSAWCVSIPWNSNLEFAPLDTQDIWLLGYAIEPYLPANVAISNWTFEAYTDNAGDVGSLITGSHVEVTGTTWNKSGAASDCDFVRPINGSTSNVPFSRINVMLPAGGVKLPRVIGAAIKYWTCVWSRPQVPLLNINYNSFIKIQNSSGWFFLAPPPPAPPDGNLYPALSWIVDLKPRVTAPSGTLGSVTVNFGNGGNTNDGTWTNTNQTIAVGISVNTVTDAKVHAITGIGVTLNAAPAAGTFVFLIYAQASDGVSFNPGGFPLASKTVTSLTAGPNFIPLDAPLYISTNLSRSNSVYYVYFVSSTDVQFRLSTDPSAQQASSVVLGASRKVQCKPNLALENLFLRSDFEGVTTGISFWLNVTTDATIDPALTTTPAATTILVVTTTPPVTTADPNGTFSSSPTPSYTAPNETIDPNQTIQTSPPLDGNQNNLGGSVGIRTSSPPTTPPETNITKPKHAAKWKLIARIRDSCMSYPDILLKSWDPSLRVISYDGCKSKKKYYQSTLTVAYDAATGKEQFEALNKTGNTLVYSSYADFFLLQEVKSKPPIVVIWILLAVIGVLALVIAIAVCGYYCCRGWVYEMIGKEEEDYGVDL